MNKWASPLSLCALLAACATQAPQQVASSPPPNPGAACIEALSAKYPALVSKIAIGSIKAQTFDMLSDTSFAAESEKPKIRDWIEDRQQCVLQSDSWMATYTPPEVLPINQGGYSAFMSAAADLYNGTITYGEFAKRRAAIGSSVDQQLATVRARYQQQNDAQQHAVRQQVMMQMLGNSLAPIPYQPVPLPPRPVTTSCQFIGNQMICNSR